MLKKIVLLSIVLSCQAHERFIITGGPCVGKSTIISMLNARGYQTTPETYQMLYMMLGATTIESIGLAVFRDTLLQEQLRAENNLLDNTPAFLDRSALDILLFWQYYSLPFAASVAQEIMKRPYRAILFLEELPRGLYEQSTSRHESPEQAHAIHEYLRNKYQGIAGDLNIPMVFIPFDSPEKRVEMVLDAAAHHENQTCTASSGTYTFSCSE